MTHDIDTTDTIRYICTRCGHVKDELPYITEKHPYGDGYAEERLPDFSCCCGGEYESALTCKMCGEAKSEADNYFYEDICDDCLKEKAKDLDLVTKCAKLCPNKEKVEVDSFLVFMLHPETVNEILWDYFNKCCNSQAFGFLLRETYAKKAEEWATSNLGWFAETLVEVMKNEQRN